MTAAVLILSAALVIAGAYHFTKHFFGRDRRAVRHSHGSRVSGGNFRKVA